MKTNFNLAKSFVSRKRKEGHESLSGPGSHIVNAQKTIELLTYYIKKLNITSILDLGCGDWNWFKEVDLSNCTYVGWDACETMISDNKKSYGSHDIKFETKDIVTEQYPYVDLIICRDVLFHMTIDLGIHVVNKCRSSCKFFSCTSFNDVKDNISHKSGWGFYKINTNITPFSLNDYLIISEKESNNNHLGYSRYINIYQFK
jgi:2-polyprenyl-3-methyl-5-hydroxy-6-metoxy-1,4-benzoquinol methylase